MKKTPRYEIRPELTGFGIYIDGRLSEVVGSRCTARHRINQWKRVFGGKG